DGLAPGVLGHVQVRLVERERLYQRRDLPEDLEDLPRDLAVLAEIRPDDDELGAETDRARHRQRRPHAERARLVARGRDDAAALRTAADRDRSPAERRIVALLDRRVERVHVDVEDLAEAGHRVPQRVPGESVMEGIAGRALSRTGSAGVYPHFELRRELGVRYGNWIAADAGRPAPENELVMADVLEQRRQVLTAIGLLVFEGATEFAARNADEDHLGLGRRQMPVRRSGRHVGTPGRRRVRREMTGAAGKPRSSFSIGPAHDVLGVRAPLVELKRCVTGDVAILATRVLEH